MRHIYSNFIDHSMMIHKPFIFSIVDCGIGIQLNLYVASTETVVLDCPLICSTKRFNIIVFGQKLRMGTLAAKG